MADTSGNMKLVVGAVIGAAAAVAIVLTLQPTPQAPAPAGESAENPVVEAPKPAAEAPEAPAPEAPIAAPATRAADWRATTEVGAAAPPAANPKPAPQNSRQIRDYLQRVGRQSGDEKALKKLRVATYTTHFDGRSISLTVHGVEGVLLRDPALDVTAVFRPTQCVALYRGRRENCSTQVKIVAQMAYVAHAATVMLATQAQGLRVSEIATGADGQEGWTSLIAKFGARSPKLKVFIDAAQLQTRYASMQMPENVLLPGTPALKPKEGERAPTEGDLTSLALDGWRTFAMAVRLPSLWCERGDKGRLEGQGGRLKLDECTAAIRVSDIAPAADGAKLALPMASDKISIRSRAGQDVALAPAAVGATALFRSVGVLSKKVGDQGIAEEGGGLFVVRGSTIAFALQLSAKYAGTRTRLAPEARVATGRMKAAAGELVAAVVAFEKKAVAAGFMPIPGDRLIYPIIEGEPDPKAQLQFMVEVPVAR
ncbi:MAG: hypothetical protein KC502_18485 [Myxococcales bacterium]|nr:hypothetical protein [Myxococcales bacterium]